MMIIHLLVSDHFQEEVYRTDVYLIGLYYEVNFNKFQLAYLLSRVCQTQRVYYIILPS
jgi:hypothetical protein